MDNYDKNRLITYVDDIHYLFAQLCDIAKLDRLKYLVTVDNLNKSEQYELNEIVNKSSMIINSISFHYSLVYSQSILKQKLNEKKFECVGKPANNRPKRSTIPNKINDVCFLEPCIDQPMTKKARSLVKKREITKPKSRARTETIQPRKTISINLNNTDKPTKQIPKKRVFKKSKSKFIQMPQIDEEGQQQINILETAMEMVGIGIHGADNHEQLLFSSFGDKTRNETQIEQSNDQITNELWADQQTVEHESNSHENYYCQIPTLAETNFAVEQITNQLDPSRPETNYSDSSLESRSDSNYSNSESIKSNSCKIKKQKSQSFEIEQRILDAYAQLLSV